MHLRYEKIKKTPRILAFLTALIFFSNQCSFAADLSAPRTNEQPVTSAMNTDQPFGDAQPPIEADLANSLGENDSPLSLATGEEENDNQNELNHQKLFQRLARLVIFYRAEIFLGCFKQTHASSAFG